MSAFTQPAIALGSNQTVLTLFWKIHPQLRVYRLGGIDMSWSDSEDTTMGGDRRLYPIGVATAAWKPPQMYRCSFDAFLQFLGLDEALDAPVTVRTYNSRINDMVVRNATLQFIVDQNFSGDPFEVLTPTFNYIDLKAF